MSRSPNSQRQPPIPEPAAWNPTMTIITAIVFAFFLGLFAGQELLHRPQVVAGAPAQAPPAMEAAPASNPTTTAGDSASPAAGDTTSAVPPMGHDDASMRAKIDGEADPTRLRMMGGIFLESHKLDMAELALKKALKKAPGDAASHALLGFVLEEAGKNAEARTQLSESLKLNPPESVKQTIKQELDRLAKS